MRRACAKKTFSEKAIICSRAEYIKFSTGYRSVRYGDLEGGRSRHRTGADGISARFFERTHFSVITNSATPIANAADAISAVQGTGAGGGPYGRKALPATGIYKNGTTEGNIYCIYSTGGPNVTIQICTPEYQYSMVTVDQTLAGTVDDVVIEL